MNSLKFVIGGLQKCSLIDYPGIPSAVLFTQGCNFRCGYCHNPELVCAGKGQYEISEILDFLDTRKGKLHGVVVTGGEPTLQPDLVKVLALIKQQGFLVKLDSNGSNPEVLEYAISQGVVDYIAMDIKAPLSRYTDISHYGGLVERIQRSREMLLEGRVSYEFRTTIVAGQLFPEDMESIGEEISGAEMYALQQFIPTKTVDENFLSRHGYSSQELEMFRRMFEERFVKKCIVRE